MALLGTGGGFVSHTQTTVDELWTQIRLWDNEHRVMTAVNYNSAMGLVGGHAYSLIHTYVLSNGARLVMVRNPWGSYEWTGAYGD